MFSSEALGAATVKCFFEIGPWNSENKRIQILAEMRCREKINGLPHQGKPWCGTGHVRYHKPILKTSENHSTRSTRPNKTSIHPNFQTSKLLNIQNSELELDGDRLCKFSLLGLGTATANHPANGHGPFMFRRAKNRFRPHNNLKMTHKSKGWNFYGRAIVFDTSVCRLVWRQEELVAFVMWAMGNRTYTRLVLSFVMSSSQKERRTCDCRN